MSGQWVFVSVEPSASLCHSSYCSVSRSCILVYSPSRLLMASSAPPPHWSYDDYDVELAMLIITTNLMIMLMIMTMITIGVRELL